MGSKVIEQLRHKLSDSKSIIPSPTQGQSEGRVLKLRMGRLFIVPDWSEVKASLAEECCSCTWEDCLYYLTGVNRGPVRGKSVAAAHEKTVFCT